MKNKQLKIAVITGWAHHKLGGVENYCAICYANWASKYEVVEFPLLKTGLGDFTVRNKTKKITIDYSLLGWKPYSIMWAKTYKKSIMEKIYQNFDLIILNTSFPPRKWINHPKSILVQHMHAKWYSLKGKNWKVSLGQFFASWLFGVGTFANSFKNAQNIVFFPNENSLSSNAKNVTFIAHAHKLKNEIESFNLQRKGFNFIGRIENQQKNIDDLIKLANLNIDLNIYGRGHDQKIIKKKLLNESQYKGPLEKKEIDNILQQTKGLIITSNYEGFPFTIVEALSNGTPVILFDTFNSAHFFAKSQAVFLIKKGDIQTFNEKIAWLRNLSAKEYNKISQNGVAFAQKYLSKEAFWENWTIFLNKTINNVHVTTNSESN